MTKPIPWTKGNEIKGSAPREGAKFTLAEKASRVSVVRVVELLSSAAESIMDCSPMGLIKYSGGSPEAHASWLLSVWETAKPQLRALPVPFDQPTEYGCVQAALDCPPRKRFA